MRAILALNAGSSSIKFAIFNADAALDDPRLIRKGHVAQVGADVELLIESADDSPVERSLHSAEGGVFDHDKALARVFAWLETQRGGMRLAAVAHRVVHGGAGYAKPLQVTDDILRDLDALVPLAPLHQPFNLKPIRLIRERWPEVVQVACFDTAFHATQQRVARAFALPRRITDLGVQRYGFHGISYEYIATQLPRVLGDRAAGKVIVAHLGNGASLCAMVGARSVASTMGFSALDGLVMGTRSGTLDPGAVLYLLQALGMSADEVSDLLYRGSGLLGLSGISGDMQVLLASADPHAAEAVDLFVHRIVCEIGSLAAAMGGVDALIFTAGIGEHAAAIRARVSAGCAWLGAVLDEQANERGEELIHAPRSALRLAVIPTNEERMMALHTLRLIGSALRHSI